MQITDARKMDIAAMLRMTEYLTQAARELGLTRAEVLYQNAFDAVALRNSNADVLSAFAPPIPPPTMPEVSDHH